MAQKLSIGIVGLPNVGKSTLFKILTRQEVHIANYPFATIDPNIGIVPVPDERVDKLAELNHSEKKIPAVVELYDIAGLVKGASTGEGLGNQFLSHIRETQTIVVVLRVFKSSEIIHVENSVDPERDMAIINTELIIKDLETVEKRIGGLEKESRAGDRLVTQTLKELTEIKKHLLADQLLSSQPETISLIRANRRISELNLLTVKKQLYLLNGEESEVRESLKQKIKAIGGDYICFDLSKTEKTDLLIKKSYEILDLISFLTTGEDETRAWTIKKGTKAPEAAGVIHTDFEKKFIRAEVIAWDKLLDVGSWTKAKEKGLVRTEGKEYIVQDGDVLVVRHG